MYVWSIVGLDFDAARSDPCKWEDSIGGFRILVIVSVLCWATAGRADQTANATAAAKAFTEGQKASLAGDHAHAAELFELADSIAPTPEALRSAARSRRAAGHNAIAALRAEQLLQRYPDDASSSELGRQILAELAPALSRYAVTCTKPCTLAIDGRAAVITEQTNHVVYAMPGTHEMTASFKGGPATSETVTAKAGERATIELEPPPDVQEPPEQPPPPLDSTALPELTNTAPVESKPHRSSGLSPIYAIAGGVLTLGLGAATTWSGLNTLDARDEFNDNPTTEQFDRGVDKQRRTNILLGATAAVGVTTLAIALFWTRWSGSDGPDSGASGRERQMPVQLDVSEDGFAVGFASSF